MERISSLRNSLKAAAIIAALPLAAAAQTTYQLNVGNGQGRTGETVKLDVRLAETDKVAGLNFTIVLPNTNTVQFADTPVELDSSLGTAATLDFNKVSPTELRAIIYSKATPPAAWYSASPKNQLVAKVALKVVGTDPGTVNLTIDNTLTTGSAIPVRKVGLSDAIGTGNFGTQAVSGGNLVPVGAAPVVTITGPTFSKIDVSFSGGPSGWLFREIFPGPFNTDPNSSPLEGSVGGASIGLKVADPTKSFGFWTSPGQIIPPTTDTNQLLRVNWPISTSETDAAAAPGFRLRLNASDFTTAEVLTVDSPASVSGGRLSPTTTVETFDMYVKPTDSVLNALGDTGYTAALDILNLDATVGGAANSAVRLSELHVSAANLPAVGTPVASGTFNFAGIGTSVPAGWNKTDNTIITNLGTIDGASFPNTVAGSVEDGLKLTATNTNLAGGQFGFGFWTSPAITLTGGQFYKLTATIVSTSADATKTPHFRVRLNSEDIQWSRYNEVVQKSTDTSAAPTTSGTQYDLFFVYPTKLNGVPARFSIDMVNDQTTDDPSGSFKLTALSVQSMTPPTFP